MNTITIMRERNLALIRAQGLWQPEALSDFVDDLRRQLSCLGAGLGSHALLIDLTSSQVSPAAAVAMFTAILTDPRFAAIRAKHIAMVSTSALFRMQLERIAATRPGIRVFTTEPDAMDWIEAERSDGRNTAA